MFSSAYDFLPHFRHIRHRGALQQLTTVEAERDEPCTLIFKGNRIDR